MRLICVLSWELGPLLKCGVENIGSFLFLFRGITSPFFEVYMAFIVRKLEGNLLGSLSYVL